MLFLVIRYVNINSSKYEIITALESFLAVWELFLFVLVLRSFELMKTWIKHECEKKFMKV